MFQRSFSRQQSAYSTGATNSPTSQQRESVGRPPVGTELVLIRGLPGSGKSTMAREMTSDGFEHFEADMFFTVNGVYTYDPARIRDAHSWCQRKTRQALANGNPVVVSNTFTRLLELEPYRSMTTNLRIVEMHGKWENVHGVPADMLQRMVQRWEPQSVN